MTVAPPYPAARRSGTVRNFHGTAVPDPYDWLESSQSRETQTWNDAQTRVTEAFLASLMPLRSRLRDLLDTLPRDTPAALPIACSGARFYLEPSPAGGMRLVRAGSDGARTRIDPADFPETQGLRLNDPFFAPSPGGRYAVLGLVAPGSDQVAMHLFDVEGRRLLTPRWPTTAHMLVSWLPDESGFAYALGSLPQVERPGVHLHRMGTASQEDSWIFRLAEGHIAFPLVTPAGDALLAKSLDFVTQDASLDLVDIASGDLCPLLPFGPAFNVIGFAGDEVVVETLRDAPNGRICAVPLSGGPIRELAAEQRHALALDHHAIRSGKAMLSPGTVLATVTVECAHRLRIVAGDDAGEDLPFPEPATVLSIGRGVDGAPEVATTSFSSPYTRYRIDIAERRLVEIERVPGVIGAVASQHFCTSRDGTRVPFFVVRPRGTVSPLPTLLYGYGGWGSSLTPRFRADLGAWLALGGAYAVANIRGGGEYGAAWHKAGAGLRRQASFDDFHAVAAALVEQQVCARGALAIRGASNGGLLTAVAANQRPDLFAAVASEIPLADVINLDRLPAGGALAAEFGDPVADARAFAAIADYSPLQNVAPQPYRPAIFVAPAERDERIPPAGAAKWAAALQASAGPGQVALYRPVAGEGHVGWSWSATRALLADELAFLWHHARRKGRPVGRGVPK